MHNLTGFQRDLLFVLLDMDAPNGQDIKEEIEKSQDRNILHGRLYANLNTLAKKKFVEKGEHDGRTNRYSITTRGKRAIEARYRWQVKYMESEELSPS